MKLKTICTQLILAFLLMLPAFKSIAVYGDTRPYELMYVDEKLNKCYKLILSKLNRLDLETLKKAQRQWIKFRDMDCMDELIDCTIDRTETRFEELKGAKFIDKEGNYSVAHCEK